ncbi:MAG: GatB/YqeY domain-containing protein [Bacteroidales bacterium]|nr:GatB/YqeY domain-containing protein [Bacteroidales bacterium]
MELEKQIQEDIKAAMKAKEAVRLSALRAIKAEILLAKTAENASGELTDADIVKIIMKLVKQRKESALQYTEAGRQELADNELAEAEALSVYLPKQLSEAEVAEILKGIAAEVGATKPQDMGKVMGVATKRLAGQADGRVISALVKKILSNA